MKAICPGCGRPAATTRELTSYHYRESGLENLWIHGGVTETRCGNCGVTHVRVTKEWQLLQVIAMGLLMHRGFLTGPEMKFVRRACQLSQAELAAAIKHRRATIAEREARRDPRLSLAEEILLRLVLVRSFREHLSAPNQNFLPSGHRAELDRYAQSMADSALELARQMLGRMTAEMNERNEQWELKWTA